MKFYYNYPSKNKKINLYEYLKMIYLKNYLIKNDDKNLAIFLLLN